MRETAEGSLASHLSPLTSHPVYLRPRLFLDRGPRHLRRVMREVARRLGCSARRADRALEVAVRAQQEFRRWLQERGQQVYQSLPPDATAFVVLGRPYTLHDPAVNMEIGRKIQDLGILAIPADFLPLDQPDITDRWPNMYARQVQKKLAAARLIRADRRLRAVVLTYFGCGPDSFANPFFKDELGQPCFVMQIDEHTADAGMITRLEAFTDTALGAGCGNRDAGCGVGDDTRHTPITASPPSADPSTLHSPLSTPDLRTSPPAPSPSTERGCPKGGGEVVAGPRSPVAAPIPRLAGKKLWIPHASQGAHVLAAALRAYQVDAQVLPRSPDLGLNLARAAISEDVCVPMLYTTEDILRRIEQPDFDPQREAFFQGNSLGPCRFGMYCMMQRQILDKRGLPEVEIFTLGSRSEHGGLGTLFSLVAWDGLVAHDMLEKMLHHTRPYEIPVGGAPGGDQQPATGVDVGTPHPASRIPHPPPLSPVAGCRLPVADSPSERIFQKYLALICDLMKPHRDLVESSRGKWLAARGRHLGALLELVRSAQHEFAAVERAPEPRPLVGLVGEFYVRLHDLSNQGVIRKVEKLGGEVWLAPLTEFFSYANRIAGKQSLDRWRDTLQWADLKDGINKAFLDWLAGRDEHLIFHAALPYLHGFDDIPSKEVIAQGSLYLNPCFGGEAICSLGKSEDFARRGLDGLISVGPFNCMPGNIVTALAPTLRRRHHGIPFLNLDYDGFVDSSRDTKLISFMAQVKERARRL